MTAGVILSLAASATLRALYINRAPTTGNIYDSQKAVVVAPVC